MQFRTATEFYQAYFFLGSLQRFATSRPSIPSPESCEDNPTLVPIVYRDSTKRSTEPSLRNHTYMRLIVQDPEKRTMTSGFH
mmetsp:Transcript_23168/g.39598  ORF Transcript_23168/g.39598 Transcript_23168/m.39598 type:complete len:82 (+) Transcript_23168:137-382(+)